MKQIGDLVFVSGQGPTKDGVPVIAGKVGGDLTIEEGYQAARLAVLNSLAILKDGLGSLDKVREVVHLRGFVNSAPGFDQQPRVMNGASELLEQVFGEVGKHARAALGTSDLPFGIAVEVELIVSV